MLTPLPSQSPTRRTTFALLAAIAIFVSLLRPPSAQAAGLLVAEGGLGGVLEIKEHTVDVTINNGIAVTHVEQVFRNTENRIVEALYTFPVPRGASVASFSMWINGKEMIGEVLEKERARQVYESYKATKRDPGLLEQTDYRSFEMRIFPIAAGAEQRVRITYYQELGVDHDWSTYVYPLATATHRNIDQRTTGKFAMTMRIKSEVPIAKIESPSHRDSFVIVKHSDSFQEASFEATGGDLSRDVVLACNLARPKTGLDLIASKPQGEDGYFMLTLTAGQELAAIDKGMDYVFVLDVSGSMQDDGKLAMSIESLQAFFAALGEKDRVEVIAFNAQPTSLFKALKEVNDGSRREAAQFLKSQSPKGGTVLAPALTMAYKYRDADGKRPLNVVILSDGLTENRERAELLRLIGERPAETRVFCIGVGNDVDRRLLEQVADRAGGLAAFISRGDDFQRQAQAFRRKLMHPTASGVAFAFDGAQVYDVEPREVADLYHGAPVRVYGRYKGGGDLKIKVTAKVQGQAIQQDAVMTLPKSDDGNAEIERMWAWKRIDSLLKEADAGAGAGKQSAIDRVVQLGEAYSIATEYTSFIVLENDAEYKRWKIDRRNALRADRDRTQQAKLQEDLKRLREQAMAKLGPEKTGTKLVKANIVDSNVIPISAPAQPTKTNADAKPADTKQRGVDFNFGGGALDPLSVGLAVGLGGLALRHRRRQRAARGSES
jgi:Ca-activated chloride channel family protein